MHVLNPEWVTNGIYKILNAETIARKRGELFLNDLNTILDSTEYPPTMHIFLLDLMRKFELCFEFYENNGQFLVPELLGKEEPDLTPFDAEDALRFDYKYNIIPEGLLPRFIVRSRALNRSRARWRTGVILGWEGNEAVVKADPQDRHVSISVIGPLEGRRRLLAVLRADLEHIHRSIPKLQALGVVPVKGYSGLSVDYESLLVMERENESEYPAVHDGKFVKLQIRDLLRGVDDTRTTKAAHKTGESQAGVRVAFSSSHKDEELRDQLETHLKLMQRQELITSWHDRRIMPGETWKGKIEDAFFRADVVLLLISADFIASDYCFEIEMKTVLERAEAGTARVVPIILRECDWHSAPFGKLQALPKDGIAVTRWPNRDEAWTDVSRGLRRLVEEIRSLPHRL